MKLKLLRGFSMLHQFYIQMYEYTYVYIYIHNILLHNLQLTYIYYKHYAIH